MRKVCNVVLSFLLAFSFGFGATNHHASAQPADGSKLKIMTLNVLTTSKQPIGDDAAQVGKTRGERLIGMLEVYRPDSIGLNEVTEEWRQYLEDTVLTHSYSDEATYAIAGLTADDGTTALKSGSDEYSPILYRSDKYDLAATGGFWLSPTPDVKSKYTDIKDSNGKLLYKGMTFERVASYAVLKYKGTDQVAYIHINPHYDHQSADYINYLCAKLVKSKADELAKTYNRPVIITGDMNSTENDASYKYLAGGENGYLDAKYVTDNYSTLPTSAGYADGYNENDTTVIDHIFISAGNVGVYKHDVLKDPYLSDHSAVYVELALDNMPKLSSIELNGTPLDDFSGNTFTYDAYVSDSNVNLGLAWDEEDTVIAKANGGDSRQIASSGGGGVLPLSLNDGGNTVELYVKSASGLCTKYTLNIYKEYGNARPVISEIFPNAEAGYKYFEVTNVGTRSMPTEDYAFLWGNIQAMEDHTAKVNWEGILELGGQNRIIRPCETVVFWLTNGWSGSEAPAVDDFNAKYYTDLSDEDIVILDPSRQFVGYIPDDNGHIDKTSASNKLFNMGSNAKRGMRIAQAKDENGKEYGWTRQSTNSSFNGPTVSASSYYGVSDASLTASQLFKFKYVEGRETAAVSDVLDAQYATPGKYDEKLGNEPKDAYSRIEAENFDTYVGVAAEGDWIGSTIDGSWAFYSNVDFGDEGAGAVVFRGAVKSSNASGHIEIYIDGKNDGSLEAATKIATVATSPTGDDWSVFREFRAELNRKVTGIHNVTLVFKPASGKKYVINPDYFVFEPYRQKADLREVSDIRFLLDGEALAEDSATVIGVQPSKTRFTLSAEADYSPADADFSITWVSNNPNVATVDAATGTVTVVGRGTVTFNAEVYTNKEWFATYTTPEVAFDYRVSAYEPIEAEWAVGFTEGYNKKEGGSPTPTKQSNTKATGMSSNVTDGYNLLGDTVDQSTARYAGVDFGDGVANGVVFNMALRTERCYGTAEIYLADENWNPGPRIGYVTVTPEDATDGGAGNYNTYKPFSGVITDNTVTGVHNLVLKFNTETYYVGNIDYFFFTKEESAPESGEAKPTWTDGTVTAYRITSTSVTLNWSGASVESGTITYAVYRNGELLDTVGENTYVVHGLTPNTTYRFTIQAGDENGNWSTDGPSVTVTTLPKRSGGSGADTDSGGGGSGKESPSTGGEQPEMVVKAGKVILHIAPSPNGEQAIAALDEDAFDRALELAPPGSGGNGKMVIQVPEQEAAKSYAVILPAKGVARAANWLVMEIQTALARLLIPASCLAQAAEEATVVSFGVAEADGGVPGAEVQQWVGHRPVLELGATADGRGINPAAPVAVSVPYQPSEEELADPEHIVVFEIDGNGNAIAVPGGKYDASSGAVTFTAAHFGTYAVGYVVKSFDDLDAAPWAKKPIEVLASKGIIRGVGGQSFAPREAITRADFMLLLVKTLGLTAEVDGNFSDVQPSDYYYDAVGIAKALEIAQGKGDNLFDPRGSISRQEMMTMTAKALRAAGKLAEPGSLDDLAAFRDKEEIAEYAVDSVASLVKAGLIVGADNLLKPAGIATRAEAAVLLYKICNK